MCEKHFKVSYNESHKVKVLARIYFNVQDKVGRSGGGEHFLFSIQEMKVKTQNCGSYL
jgi:hypothetical protein